MLTATRYVVSAQDSPYQAWQALLAHYSCLTRVGQPLIVIVHESDGGDHGDFEPIERTGGLVVRARDYSKLPSGEEYQPRNTAGSLLVAADIVAPDDRICLCDPDFVFLKTPEFPAALSAAEYGYLDYSDPDVIVAAARVGVTSADLSARGDALCCGVPYLIPAGLAARLAHAWLHAIDAFVEPRWWDVMHAFGIAVARLKLPLERAALADSNYWPDEPPLAPIIHYCYDNPNWSKREYQSGRTDPATVWRPEQEARRGTILGEVLTQLREASAYYGFAPGPATDGLVGTVHSVR